MDPFENWTKFSTASLSDFQPLVETPRLKICFNRRLGAIEASHFIGDKKIMEVDYARWWTENGQRYMESLQACRTRQAKIILGALSEESFSIESLMDFGAGPGWFLESCRKFGVSNLVAADASIESVEFLKKKNFKAFAVYPDSEGAFRLEESIDYSSIRVVSFLDVIEHFPPELCVSNIKYILSQMSQLEKVVIKVPYSRGLFFRISMSLAKLGKFSLLEQLFQVGTYPPHFQVFNEVSLRRVLESLELKPIKWIVDPDFEADSFGQRVKLLSMLPKWLGQLIGRLFFRIIQITGWQDSIIVIAVPKSK